mmetsp:Transcript_47088/g.111842  ORF Transcript_47088/g.111842 Transcript_47088/m.111842 type:complete len:225 (+) Transcript_47088:46-720(+)
MDALDEGKTGQGLASQEGQNPLLAAIKREVEALESRLVARIARIEQQVDVTAVLERVAATEQKLQAAEHRHRQSEVVIAQLSGLVRGVSEELQCVQRAGRREAEVKAPGYSNLDTKDAALPMLQEKVTLLSERIESHADALEQVRAVLELQLKQQEEKPRLSLESEVRVLSECIAAAEGAVHSLAPRLLKAVSVVASSPRRPAMVEAAKSLETAVRRAQDAGSS